MTTPSPALPPMTNESELSHAFLSAMQYSAEEPLTIAQVPLFQNIINHLRECVIVTDPQGNIKTWNRSAENLTGLAQESMLGNVFSSKLLGLRDEHGEPLSDDDCPWRKSIRTRQPVAGNYRVIGRSGRESRVELDIVPLRSTASPESNQLEGMLVVLYDASVQNSLKRQLKDLFESSMVDPLTKVFNRAEFERVIEQYISTKKKSPDFKCSLIVCDIDFFKAINDNYNHYVGDQTLIAFADLLKKFIRSHDIVARFGGEEFLILCGNCDLESAVARAEEIRVTLTRTAMPMLDGKCVTASFGVAELKESESATDLFVRADSALFQAKGSGRNRVIASSAAGSTSSAFQDDAQADEGMPSTASVSGLTWRQTTKRPLIDEEYVSTTPVAVLVEKLRGYVLERDAKILVADNEYAKIHLAIPDPKQKNRIANMVVEIEFQVSDNQQDKSRKRSQTFIHLVISEGQRKWRSAKAADLATPLLLDLRRFFMINDEKSRLTIDRAVTKSTRQ